MSASCRVNAGFLHFSYGILIHAIGFSTLFHVWRDFSPLGNFRHARAQLSERSSSTSHDRFGRRIYRGTDLVSFHIRICGYG
jgi:hypothetical protein